MPLTVIEYRLKQLEEKSEKYESILSLKLDTTISKLQETTTALLLLEARLKALETDNASLGNLKTEFSNLNNRIKYQLAPGALGGGLGAVLIELGKIILEQLWQ